VSPRKPIVYTQPHITYIPAIFTFQIIGWLQENAQILRSHSVLRTTIVDVPRQQYEVADKKDVQTGPVPVQVRRDPIRLERVFQKTRVGPSTVHLKRYNGHLAGSDKKKYKVSIIFTADIIGRYFLSPVFCSLLIIFLFMFSDCT